MQAGRRTAVLLEASKATRLHPHRSSTQRGSMFQHKKEQREEEALASTHKRSSIDCRYEVQPTLPSGHQGLAWKSGRQSFTSCRPLTPGSSSSARFATQRKAARSASSVSTSVSSRSKNTAFRLRAGLMAGDVDTAPGALLTAEGEVAVAGNAAAVAVAPWDEWWPSSCWRRCHRKGLIDHHKGR